MTKCFHILCWLGFLFATFNLSTLSATQFITLTLKDGTSFHNVTVKAANASSVKLLADEGYFSVPRADLPALTVDYNQGEQLLQTVSHQVDLRNSETLLHQLMGRKHQLPIQWHPLIASLQEAWVREQQAHTVLEGIFLTNLSPERLEQWRNQPQFRMEVNSVPVRNRIEQAQIQAQLDHLKRINSWDDKELHKQVIQAGLAPWLFPVSDAFNFIPAPPEGNSIQSGKLVCHTATTLLFVRTGILDALTSLEHDPWSFLSKHKQAAGDVNAPPVILSASGTQGRIFLKPQGLNPGYLVVLDGCSVAVKGNTLQINAGSYPDNSDRLQWVYQGDGLWVRIEQKTRCQEHVQPKNKMPELVF